MTVQNCPRNLRTVPKVHTFEYCGTSESSCIESSTEILTETLTETLTEPLTEVLTEIVIKFCC